MTDYNDLSSRVADRERARSTVRTVTVTAGVARLVTAGVVAYALPGPTHHSSTTTTGASSANAGSASPSASPASWRGESDDGGSSGRSLAPASTGNGSSGSHTTSGGS